MALIILAFLPSSFLASRLLLLWNKKNNSNPVGVENRTYTLSPPQIYGPASVRRGSPDLSVCPKPPLAKISTKFFRACLFTSVRQFYRPVEQRDFYWHMLKLVHHLMPPLFSPSVFVFSWTFFFPSSLGFIISLFPCMVGQSSAARVTCIIMFMSSLDGLNRLSWYSSRRGRWSWNDYSGTSKDGQHFWAFLWLEISLSRGPWSNPVLVPCFGTFLLRARDPDRRKRERNVVAKIRTPSSLKIDN